MIWILLFYFVVGTFDYSKDISRKKAIETVKIFEEIINMAAKIKPFLLMNL